MKFFLLSSIPNLNVLNPETHLKKVWQEVEKKGPQIAEQLLGQITKIHADAAPVVDEFKDSISKAISQARHHDYRDINVTFPRSVPREIAESQFNGFSLTITPVLLLAGKIIDKYPFLLNIIIFVVSMSLLPNLPLLGPILRSFGFGPLGPIKGSMAAWAQRIFWGGAVAPGSWFAIMQRLGMTATGSAIGKLLASAGITAMFGRKTQGQQAL
ncbi:hypothetical protein Agabi119p4_8823 [Agaricus bisporus var. burnettii]|uniref:Uncharacterized protein n=1 Tax=Agaricus bisporus var. burnettii TaxID=192524 RepID=A0A8H7C530_AGABI|nr:hypothetical protein Agabi119p4_8823 [Agaricus bisporus var. burnettii]